MKGLYYHYLSSSDPFAPCASVLTCTQEIRLSDSQGPFPFKSHPSLTCSLKIFCSLSLVSYEVGHLGLVEIPQKSEIIVLTHKARAKSVPGPSIVPDI